jgi:hypothetical protein
MPILYVSATSVSVVTGTGSKRRRAGAGAGAGTGAAIPIGMGIGIDIGIGIGMGRAVADEAVTGLPFPEYLLSTSCSDGGAIDPRLSFSTKHLVFSLLTWYFQPWRDMNTFLH